MSLDGAMLHLLKKEISQTVLGSRIDRIMQPSKEEVLLQFRSQGKNYRLLLNAGANNPRIHFTELDFENPITPPMYCMLLRKYLQNAKFVDITQQGLDRILFLHFEIRNDLGDPVLRTLVLEIMGKHSNLILTEDNRIVDALNRVDFETSRVRQVLPGMSYVLPPAQNKYNLLETDVANVIAKINGLKWLPLSKAIQMVLQGFSLLPCQEISTISSLGKDPTVMDLSTSEVLILIAQLEKLKQVLITYTGIPTMVISQDGRPKELTFIPITHYSPIMQTKEFSSYSVMLDHFYAKRDLTERMQQKSGHLLRFVENLYARITRRLEVQRQELEQCKNREEDRIYGDLLTANIHRMQKGMLSITLENFYDNNRTVEVSLNPRKTPAQNAQIYYARYRKADTAERKLAELLQSGSEEQDYIASVLDSLKRAQSENDLEMIQEELRQNRYIRNTSTKKKKKQSTNEPLLYQSSDGFDILVGKNNFQNDYLTFKLAHKQDIWLHVQQMPGSHTVILTQGKEVPNTTLEEAAILAAFHSNAAQSTKVPVDYTDIKYVKKPNAAKPGMVIYETYRTILVTPKEEHISNLRVQKKRLVR